MKRIFTGELLIDGTGADPIPEPVIIVEDGRISAIGSKEEIPLPQEEMGSVEALGGTILPGLIDGHVHIASGGADDPEWDKIKDSNERLILWCVRNAQLALAAGITTLRDCGARHGITIPLRDGIEAGYSSGPRLWVCGPYLTTTCGHGHHRAGWEVDSAHELRKAVRTWIKEGADFIKIMATGGSMTPISNRRRAQFSVEELRLAVEDAHRLQRRVAVHVNATEGIRNSVEAGVDTLEHCNWLGEEEGTIEYDEKVALKMAEKGQYVGLNMEAAFTPLVARDGSYQDWGEQTRWDLMRRMQRLGVKVFLTTDFFGRRVSELPILLERMVKEGKASAMEVIEMSTRTPAEALGLEKDIGTLQVGKLADMIFLEGNPLEDIGALSRVAGVVKGGEVVVLEGELRGMGTKKLFPLP